jgi:hypothetical protein
MDSFDSNNVNGMRCGGWGTRWNMIEGGAVD